MFSFLCCIHQSPVMIKSCDTTKHELCSINSCVFKKKLLPHLARCTGMYVLCMYCFWPITSRCSFCVLIMCGDQLWSILPGADFMFLMYYLWPICQASTMYRSCALFLAYLAPTVYHTFVYYFWPTQPGVQCNSYSSQIKPIINIFFQNSNHICK